MPRSASFGRISFSSRKRTSGSPPTIETWIGFSSSTMRQDAIDQLLALVVGDLAQRDVAAEVIVAVGVAAGQRSGHSRVISIDREGSIAAQDLPPRGDDAFHPGSYIERNSSRASA